MGWCGWRAVPAARAVCQLYRDAFLFFPRLWCGTTTPPCALFSILLFSRTRLTTTRRTVAAPPSWMDATRQPLPAARSLPARRLLPMPTLPPAAALPQPLPATRFLSCYPLLPAAARRCAGSACRTAGCYAPQRVLFLRFVRFAVPARFADAVYVWRCPLRILRRAACVLRCRPPFTATTHTALFATTLVPARRIHLRSVILSWFVYLRRLSTGSLL